MDILTCTLCKPPVTFRTHGELTAHLLSVHGKQFKRAMGGSGQADPDPREVDDDDHFEEPESREEQPTFDDHDDTTRDAEQTLGDK